jgi:RNA polymerase sigma-70 factor (ECF subfamily)
MNGQEDFLKLFLRHEGDLRAFIGSLVRDRHAREDVFQEVALTLWQEFTRFDPTRSFGAWARGVAANKIMRRWEKDKRFPMPFPPEAVLAVLDAYDRTEKTAAPGADALEECLGHLPDKSRKLLALRYEQSLRLEAIAETVQSTLEAVQKALSRIRMRLADCVRERMTAG